MTLHQVSYEYLRMYVHASSKTSLKSRHISDKLITSHPSFRTHQYPTHQLDPSRNSAHQSHPTFSLPSRPIPEEYPDSSVYIHSLQSSIKFHQRPTFGDVLAQWSTTSMFQCISVTSKSISQRCRPTTLTTPVRRNFLIIPTNSSPI